MLKTGGTRSDLKKPIQAEQNRAIQEVKSVMASYQVTSDPLNDFYFWSQEKNNIRTFVSDSNGSSEMRMVTKIFFPP